MAETPAQTRLDGPDSPGGGATVCDTCRNPFAPTGRWKQRFCSDKCRNAFHTSMKPEVLRRDIEDLRREVASLKAMLEQVNKDADRRDADMEASPA